MSNNQKNAPVASVNAAPAKAKIQDTFKYRVIYSTPWGVLTTRNGDGYFNTIEEAAYVAAQLNERLADRGNLNQFDVAAERHYAVSGEHHRVAVLVVRVGDTKLEWYEYSVADYSTEAWTAMSEAERVIALTNSYALYPAITK